MSSNISRLRTIAILLFVINAPFTVLSQIEEQEVEDVPEVVEYAEVQSKTSVRTQPLIEDYKLFYGQRGSSSYQYLYGLIQGNNEVLPMMFSYAGTSQYKDKLIFGLGRKYGMYNIKTGMWDVPIIYTSFTGLGEDLYAVKKDNKFGVITSNNEEIIGFDWSEIRKLGTLQNYILVKDFNRPPHYGIYNIIANKVIVKPSYVSIRKMRTDDYFIVQNDLKQFNLIDIKGEEVFENWYEMLIAESGGRPRFIVKVDGKMGIIDWEENSIVPLNYKSIATSPYSDGSYLAQNESGKYGFITIDGEVTLPFSYDNLSPQSYSGIAISSAQSKCGIIKVNNGKPYEIATCEYDDIKVANNIIIVQQSGRYGLMDIYGKKITELVYEDLSQTGSTHFIGKTNRLYYLIDSKGNKIHDEGYKIIEPLDGKPYNNYNSYYGTTSTYFKVQNNKGQFALMDRVGMLLTRFDFDDISRGGSSNILVSKNGKYGVYNLVKRDYLISPTYDQLIPESNFYYGILKNEIYKITLGNNVTKTKLN